jgi:hypothetical protein
MAMYSPPVAARRRWPWIAAILVVIVVGLWTALWHYASAKVETTIAGWREREAKIGRVYTCATQTIGGFPFGINVHCSNPGVELRSSQPPAALKWKDLHVTASLFTPTRLVSEYTGPLTIGEPGRPPSMVANWRQAQTAVRGLPTAPERMTTVFDDLTVDRLVAGGRENVFTARQVELAGRMVEGSAMSNPVIELTLKMAGASAPAVHPAAAAPLDADITAVLRGLKDFSPKPWPARFREIQVAGGRLDVTNARLQQGDVVTVATGGLGLTPRGRLDGELRMTVANFEKLLSTLGLDRLISQQTAPGGKFNSALGALDRLAPGLGDIARQNAGPAMVAGLGLLGQPTELEGKRAVMLPLRFTDGVASLGPIPLGPTPPLF